MSARKTSGDEAAHDILAAEAFAVPTPDPALRRGRVELPDDPTGIAEPHDVLAAEEFAMPAVSRSPTRAAVALHRRRPWPVRLAAAGAGLAVVAVRALRRP